MQTMPSWPVFKCAANTMSFLIQWRRIEPSSSPLPGREYCYIALGRAGSLRCCHGSQMDGIYASNERENMNVQTLISLALLLGYVGPVSFSVSILIKKQETCELVTTWSEFIREFNPSRTDPKARMPNIQTEFAMVPVLALVTLAIPATNFPTKASYVVPFWLRQKNKDSFFKSRAVPM